MYAKIIYLLLSFPLVFLSLGCRTKTADTSAAKDIVVPPENERIYFGPYNTMTVYNEKLTEAADGKRVCFGANMQKKQAALFECEGMDNHVRDIAIRKVLLFSVGPAFDLRKLINPKDLYNRADSTKDWFPITVPGPDGEPVTVGEFVISDGTFLRPICNAHELFKDVDYDPVCDITFADGKFVINLK